MNKPTEPDPSKTKTCTKCQLVLSASTDNFYRRKGKPYGLASRCKKCSDEDDKLRKDKRVVYNFNSRQKPESIKRKAEYQAKYARGKGKLVKKAGSHRYRARKLNAEGSWTAADIDVLFEQQQGLCAICNCSLSTYHIDHILALARGGTNYPDNLQLLCVKCNTSKKDRTMEEYMEYLTLISGSNSIIQLPLPK